MTKNKVYTSKITEDADSEVESSKEEAILEERLVNQIHEMNFLLDASQKSESAVKAKLEQFLKEIDMMDLDSVDDKTFLHSGRTENSECLGIKVLNFP